MVKTPKLYFLDTGLVVYLTKYSTLAILTNGALNGAILENYTASIGDQAFCQSEKQVDPHFLPL